MVAVAPEPLASPHDPADDDVAAPPPAIVVGRARSDDDAAISRDPESGDPSSDDALFLPRAREPPAAGVVAATDVDLERGRRLLSATDRGGDPDAAGAPPPPAAGRSSAVVHLPPLRGASSPPAPAPTRSTAHKYKHRASIGHDARIMEERGALVQARVGRPKVKSIFHAMTGARRFGGLGGGGDALHPKLLAVDHDAYGHEWTAGEQRRVAAYALLHFAAWLALTFLDPDSWLARRATTAGGGGDDATTRRRPTTVETRSFWAKLLAQQALVWLIFSACGLAVVTRGWNEGYSRKVCHVVMYLMPFLMHLAWRDDDGSSSGDEGSDAMPSIWTMSWTVWFQFLPFYLQIKPARRSSTFLMLVFKAYDRAQDRPHTLTWLLTQLAGGYVVILSLYAYLQMRGGGADLPPTAGRAVLIPIVVNVFGDGLAEPVGITFGRHKYRARALWYDGKCCAGEFKRTAEGSFVVYLSALLAALPCGPGWGLGLFTKWQHVVMCVAMPPVMTLTEAFAPHTWDNPFITLVGAAFILLTYEVVP